MLLPWEFSVQDNCPLLFSLFQANHNILQNSKAFPQYQVCSMFFHNAYTFCLAVCQKLSEPHFCSPVCGALISEQIPYKFFRFSEPCHSTGLSFLSLEQSICRRADSGRGGIRSQQINATAENNTLSDYGYGTSVWICCPQNKIRWKSVRCCN